MADDWPPEFERILNGESAAMLAQDAQLGKLWPLGNAACLGMVNLGEAARRRFPKEWREFHPQLCDATKNLVRKLR